MLPSQIISMNRTVPTPPLSPSGGEGAHKLLLHMQQKFAVARGGLQRANCLGEFFA